jgi:methyl-accepting chemotaxis protein
MRQSLEDMIRSINDAVLAVNEIAGDAKCQAENIEEVNVGLDQISQVVQSNTSMAEQSANASRQIVEQAGALNDMVSQFKIKNN